MLLSELLQKLYIPYHLGIGAEHRRQFAMSLGSFEKWLKRPAAVVDLTDQNLLAFLSEYSQTVKPSTANSKRTYLLALWRFAAESPRNLCQAPGRIPRLPEHIDVPEAWTLVEFQQILASAQCSRGLIAGLPARLWMTSLMLVLYDCGGRIGQVRKTRPQDISLEGRWINLRAATNKTHRGGLRELAEQTVDSLRPIWSCERELVWPWPFSREALDKRLRKILKAAGVAYGRDRGGLWHKFRRTSGTLIEAANGDGSRHLGNTRSVFEKHYLDPRIAGRSQLALLPRPTL